MNPFAKNRVAKALGKAAAKSGLADDDEDYASEPDSDEDDSGAPSEEQDIAQTLVDAIQEGDSKAVAMSLRNFIATCKGKY